MKDWSYYYTPVRSKRLTHAERQIYRDSQTEPILDALMTERDRRAALDAVHKQVVAHFDEVERPYFDELKELREEFWRDARQELGYTRFLTEEAVKLVEFQAEELSEDADYENIYASLYDVVLLVRAILISCREDWEAGELPWPEVIDDQV